MNHNRGICSISKVRNTIVEPISNKSNSIHRLRNSDKLQISNNCKHKWLYISQKLSVNFSFLKIVLTQTPESATSKTAGSSVNSKDKDPNPTNKEAARATPVTPPTCKEKDGQYQLLKEKDKPVAFPNYFQEMTS
jgi:hypothetical protein